MNETKESSQPTKKKMKGWQKTLIWVGGIFVLLVVIGIIGSKGKSTNTNSSTTSSGNNKNTTAQVYTVNQDVRVGDVRWKLLSARDRGSVLKASESRYATIASDKTTPGHYVEIAMEVENLGTDMKTVTDVKLVDSKSREFTSSSDTSEWVPEGKDLFILSNLNPNVPQQFMAIYEVPADASGLKVEVGDLGLFSNKKAMINLGI